MPATVPHQALYFLNQSILDLSKYHLNFIISWLLCVHIIAIELGNFPNNISEVVHLPVKGCLSLEAKDIELDAVGGQFEPYPYSRCIRMLMAPLCCDLGDCWVRRSGMLFPNSCGYQSCCQPLPFHLPAN